MKKEIIGLLVGTLLIATAVLPVVGTMNENMDITTSNIQQPTVEWKKTYGGDEFDHFHTVRQTDDGGYIACGNTEENDMYYVWLVKVDSAGNEEWSVVNYDLNGSYLTNTEFWIMGFDVSQTSDGGYIITGTYGLFVNEEDAIDFLIEQFISHNATNEEILSKIYDSYYDGFNLIREKTGKNRFFLSKNALTDTEIYLNDLIRKEIT